MANHTLAYKSALGTLEEWKWHRMFHHDFIQQKCVYLCHLIHSTQYDILLQVNI